MMTGFDHPLLDFTEGRYACVEARGLTVFLSEALADFLVSAEAAQMIPVIISRPEAWWTFAARYHVDLVRGLRIVRDGDMLVEPAAGIQAASVTALLHGQASSWTCIEAPQPEVLQAVVSVSVHHGSTDQTVLGRCVEIVGRELASCDPTAWGAHEPATLDWNTSILTRHAQFAMPESRVFISGGTGTLQGIHRAERTSAGVLETFTALTPIATLTAATQDVAERSVRTLNAISETHSMPTFGSITVVPGWRDGRIPAGPEPAAVPAAMLIGPRAVRALGVDLGQLAESFDVSVVGRRRIPSVIAAFSDPEVSPWRQAEALAHACGAESIARALQTEGGHTDAP